jgi:hypothetical protein
LGVKFYPTNHLFDLTTDPPIIITTPTAYKAIGIFQGKYAGDNEVKIRTQSNGCCVPGPPGREIRKRNTLMAMPRHTSTTPTRNTDFFMVS